MDNTDRRVDNVRERRRNIVSNFFVDDPVLGFPAYDVLSRRAGTMAAREIRRSRSLRHNVRRGSGLA